MARGFDVLSAGEQSGRPPTRSPRGRTWTQRDTSIACSSSGTSGPADEAPSSSAARPDPLSGCPYPRLLNPEPARLSSRDVDFHVAQINIGRARGPVDGPL